MAWRSHGRTNAELIDRMLANGAMHSSRVAEAMKKVDRANYLPTAYGAYEDAPQRIGFNATISAPHMHAHACETLLDTLDGANARRGSILDVGSGSGYLCAVFHHLCPDATVVGIDHIQGLADMARANLAKDGVKVVEKGPGVRIVCGDGRAGFKELAPYTVIHVGAAAPTIPDALIEQLAAPGRMFIPVGVDAQEIWQIDKTKDGGIEKKKLFKVVYIPLTDATKQWP